MYSIKICDINGNSKLSFIDFEILFRRLENRFTHLQSIKYNKYYDNNKIYIIDSNNREQYIQYIETHSKKTIKLDSKYVMKLIHKTYEKLDPDDFDTKYTYDRIINVESKQTKYGDYLIEFNKCNGKYYEVKITSPYNFDTNRLKEIKSIIN